MAQPATKGALAEAERLQEITRKADEVRRKEAAEHAEQLGRTVLTLPHKAGEDGRLSCYKIVDPSFHNWTGLAVALRDQQISDFPLCNKSFNLSYAGNDL